SVTFEFGTQLGWSWRSGGPSGSGLVFLFPLIVSVPVARYLSLELLYAPGWVPTGTYQAPPNGIPVTINGALLRVGKARPADAADLDPAGTGFRQEISLRLVLRTW